MPATTELLLNDDGRDAAIAVHGPLDYSCADAVRDQVVDAVRAYELTEITIDLRDVGFIDGFGVRALATARDAAEARGCVVSFQATAEPILRVLPGASTPDD